MSKSAVFLDMDDVPHLSEAEKRKILSGVPPWQLEARKSGIPGHGTGAIYPIPESVMLIDPINIPMHWPRSYGMDPGWNCTAVIWFAWDIDNGYVDSEGAKRYPVIAYDEYYRGQADPAVHVSAISKRGSWIPGVIDPAAQKARGTDGELLIDTYRSLGLNVSKADNTVVTGIVRCWDMLSTQQLRVFNTLANWRKEIRLYRRDEKGNIIKKNDHLMDAMRYNVMSGFEVAKAPPASVGGMPWFAWDPAMVTPGGVWTG